MDLPTLEFKDLFRKHSHNTKYTKKLKYIIKRDCL